MSTPRAERTIRELTPKEHERLTQNRAVIAKELPDLTARDQMRKEAQMEPTLSGELRRAIHSCKRSLSAIAAEAGITPIQLDEFLTGERSLRSDVLHQVAHAIGFRIQAAS